MFGVPFEILLNQGILAAAVGAFIFVGAFLGAPVLRQVIVSIFPIAFLVGYYQVLGFPGYYPKDPTEFLFFLAIGAVFFDGALGVRPDFGYLEVLLVILISVCVALIPYPVIFVWAESWKTSWPLLMLVVVAQGFAYVWCHHFQKDWRLAEAWIFWALCFFFASVYLLLNGSALLAQLAGLIVALLSGGIAAVLIKKTEVKILAHLGFLVFFFGAFCIQSHLRLSIPWWQVLLLISPVLIMPIFRGFRSWRAVDLVRTGIELLFVFTPVAIGLGFLAWEAMQTPGY